MACDEAVYLAVILITIELITRYYHELPYITNNQTNINYDLLFFQQFRSIYLLFLFASLLLAGLNYYKMNPSFLSHPLLINILPYFYVIDSFAALSLGYGLITLDFEITLISLELLANFFLLYVINRTFAPTKDRSTIFIELTAITKQFLHHSSSFLFLDNQYPNVILLTSIWRSISMTGHIAQLLNLKKYITPNQLKQYNWILTHIRNVFVLVLFVLCYNYDDIRRGFGRSAIGHISYILVRAGPVFRLGSVYVGDRTIWQDKTDIDRIITLLKGNHPFMTIEVGSLLLLGCYFLGLRIYYGLN